MIELLTDIGILIFVWVLAMGGSFILGVLIYDAVASRLIQRQSMRRAESASEVLDKISDNLDRIEKEFDERYGGKITQN